MAELGETDAFHDPEKRTLRLESLPPSSLPKHPALAPHQTASTPPELRAFIAETLNEARAFATALLPNQFQKQGSPRQSAPSTALVQLLTCDVLQSTDGKPEAWFARRSVHDNQRKSGTADLDEFEQGLFAAHSVNEAIYTPEVFDGVEVLNWRNELNESVQAQLKEDGWVDVAFDVFEMAHKLPYPLQNRVFAVAVVRGRVHGQDKKEYITAQVPVELAEVKEALYSNGRHLQEGDSATKKAKVTVGQYVAIERILEQDDAKIMWEMAMASDAKGRLPMSMQKLGVPGAIVKDVGYFIGWIEGQRKATGA